MRGLARVSAVLALGLLAALIAPVSGASAAGPIVRFEVGEPAFEGRTWTFWPKSYDADGNDLGFAAGANPVFIDVPAGTGIANYGVLETMTVTLGSGGNAMKAHFVVRGIEILLEMTLALIDVRFDLNGAPGAPPAGWSGDVFVPRLGVTLADAGVAPAEPVRAGYRFAGWNTAADGSGLSVDAHTDVFDHFAHVSPTMTLYAQWVPVLSFSGVPANSTAGDTAAFVLAGPGDISGATLSTTDPAATIDQATREIVFRAAGVHTVTASLPGYDPTETAVLVEAGPAGTLGIAASAESVQQGGALDFTVTAADEFGNPVVVDSADVQLSSSVPTDVIAGLRVSFPHASPHTITAEFSGLRASTTVEVIPTPQLAPTGATNGGAISAAAALLLLAVGGALLLSARRAAPPTSRRA